MARILLCVLPYTRGDVNPYLALARRLRAAGQDVDWLSLPEPLGALTPLVEATGARIVDTPPAWFPPLPRGEALAAIFGDPVRYVTHTRATPAIADAYLGTLTEVVRARKPDVLVSDHSLDLLQTVAVAEALQIPQAFVCASLSLLLRRPGPSLSPDDHGTLLRRTIDLHALFRRHRVRPLVFDGQIVSTALNAFFTSPACLPADVVPPPHTLLAGPILPEVQSPALDDDFPWERLREDGRVVYVSFGSLYSDAALYAKLAAAAAPLDVQLVVSTGALADVSFLDSLPGQILAVPYAPQLRLLTRARVFVTHGGFGSFNEALIAGVPMLVLPRAVDQGLQVELARTTGVGLAPDPSSTTALRDALAALLDLAGPHHAAARRMRTLLLGGSGAAPATDGIGAVTAALIALAQGA